MNKRFVITAVFTIILLSAFVSLAFAEAKANIMFKHIPKMELKVIRVIDDDFDDISDSDYNEIIQTAEKMYFEEFGVKNVTFIDSGKISIEEFFDKNLLKDKKVFETKTERRFVVGAKNDFRKFEPQIIKFLKKWKIKELQNFFPEKEQPKFDSYEKLYNAVVDQMNSKIAYISTIKKDKKPILRSEKAKLRSFINWKIALENQDKFDLVLTNTFILYDDIQQPFPHSIFAKCKVGGVSHKNNHRKTLENRVIMGSTFGMDTKIPFFMERKDEKISLSDRNKVTGAFIIAHELGHAIFKLPDFYDIGSHCLMNNSKELTYKEGYDKLVSRTKACMGYEKYLPARNAFFEAKWNFESGQYKKAIDNFTFSLKNTPKNIDGYYKGYMAEIAFGMSKTYYKMGDIPLAIRGAKYALKLYRWNDEYKKWLEQLDLEKGKK